MKRRLAVIRMADMVIRRPQGGVYTFKSRRSCSNVRKVRILLKKSALPLGCC